MQKESMEPHKKECTMCLKRTERLIDAVKMIDLIEFMEGQEANLKIASSQTEGEWQLKYEIDGKVIINNQSENLGNLVVDALKEIKLVCANH